MLPTHHSSAPSVIRSEWERRAQAHCGARAQGPAGLPLGEEGGLVAPLRRRRLQRIRARLPEAERVVAVVAETSRVENERFEPVPRARPALLRRPLRR